MRRSAAPKTPWGFSLLPLLLLLSACATTGNPGAGGTAYGRIEKELDQAVARAGSRGADADAALLPPLRLEIPAVPKETAEPRFDLAVSKAPAAQVFMALVSGTRYSMLLAPDISGEITVNLKDVTVREAMDTLRDLYGYEYRLEGTRIFVQPNTLQTRVFQINYLASKRQGVSDLRVTGSSIAGSNANQGSGSTGAANTGLPGLPGTGSGSSGTGAAGSRSVDNSRVYTTSENDFWKDLGTALSTIVGNEDGRNVVINSLSGVILVRAFPGEIRNVERYLRATQAIVERQVMLEAKIIEVSLSTEYQNGVNWSFFGGKNNRYQTGIAAPGSTLQAVGRVGDTNVDVYPGSGSAGVYGALQTATTGRGFYGLAFQTANFAALLNFLESQGNVQVLSSPRIATLNNQKAVLKVGTDEFFVTNVSTTTTTSSTGNTTSPTITVQPFFSGIALDVTPQIDEANNIILHVHPSISNVSEKQKVIDLGSQIGTFTLPLASSTINETDSIVRVQDGNIVAIGGLMKQKETVDRSGLPGASGLPGIGTLFGQKGVSSTKQELVILIKPTLIRDEDSWRQDVEDTRERVRNLDPRVGPR